MPEQRTTWIYIVSWAAAIVVIAGLGYYLWQQVRGSQTTPNSPQTSGTEPNNVINSTPGSSAQQSTDIKILATATIDPRSLTSTSSKPTITGNYTNAYGLEIVIAKGPLPETSALSVPVPNLVWSDRSDHGGGVMLSGAGSDAGTFKSTVTNSLPDGTYNVGIYFDIIYYPQTDENLARDTRTLLTQGTLTVQSKK